MEYAIVDIETTGGHPSGNGITEIAILIHNGTRVVDRFTSLVNPLQPIPLHITALTGIDDAMVAHSPTFESIAHKIYHMLTGRIFVAHNVNFDYSFVKHQLRQAALELSVPKLCTVRLSRKIKPGLPSYSLGKLCQSLGIPLNDRHRAGGDVEATAILFSSLIQWDNEGAIQSMLKKSSKEQALPPHLPKHAFEALPDSAGVYYFKDGNGKVIYVGKAKNIKKRVGTHFCGHTPNPQRQHFLRHIHAIEHTCCGSELMALLLEAAEIKRIWPLYNRAIKKPEPRFGLYQFEDQNGYNRLIVDRHKKNHPTLWSFNKQLEGINRLRQLCRDHHLCPKMCLIQRDCTGNEHCACKKEVSTISYNLRVKQAVHELREQLPSFVLFDEGRNETEHSCIWVENGSLYGMGFIDKQDHLGALQDIRPLLTPYPSNDYMMQIILSYAEKHPGKLHALTPNWDAQHLAGAGSNGNQAPGSKRPGDSFLLTL